MKIDLHMHSNHSGDGEFTPTQLINKAKELDLAMVALCDHDQINGVTEMIKAGKEQGIIVVPAAEFTCQADGYETHILAYNININSPIWQAALPNYRAAEARALQEAMDFYRVTFDMTFDQQEMTEKCRNAFFYIQPLIEELVNNPKYAHFEVLQPYLIGGSRSDLPTLNFFWDNCIKGKDYHIKVEYADYRQVIIDIHNDGGIAILAHPNNIYFDHQDLLQEVIVAGIDGIEAFSNYHSPDKNQFYLTYALKHDLLISGGSDFHGAYKPQVKMGEFGNQGNFEYFLPFINKLKNDLKS